jgi:multiple sugar transport system permease protein
MAANPAAARATSGADVAVGKKGFELLPYLFILPHFILFVVFLLWPVVYGLYISLHNWDFNRPEFRPFVGLQNYQNLFDPSSLQFEGFWETMRNTVYFVLWSTPPMVFFALLLAVLLNGKFRARNFFRGLYFAPWALSAVVASLLGWWLFQDIGGLLNAGLDNFGLEQSWLGALPWAWIAITLTTLWWTVGFNTIIYLAALQDIPESLYEAASLDGASKFQQFLRITVPLVAPVTTFIITIQLIASFQLFAQPLIMTRGGPANGTKSVIMQIYEEGFGSYRMGSAAAMSMLLAAILLIITVLNFRFFGRAEER